MRKKERKKQRERGSEREREIERSREKAPPLLTKKSRGKVRRNRGGKKKLGE